MFLLSIGIGILVLIVVLLWIGFRRPKPSTSLPPLYTGNERRGARPLSSYYDDDEFPSAELLGKMHGAGMNTTHERYEDYAESKRRGTHRPLAPGENPVSRQSPDDGLGLLGVAIGLDTPVERPARDHSPDTGGGGFETGGGFGGGDFSSGGDSGGSSD